MIRSAIMIILIICSALFLKLCYGFQGASLLQGFIAVGVLGAGTFLFEMILGRICKKFLISVIFGLIFGFVISDFLVAWVSKFSFLSPFLGSFPWQFVVRLIVLFIGVLFSCYYSQDVFCVKEVRVSLLFQKTRDFLVFRRVIRIIFLIAVVLFVLISVKHDVRVGGGEDSEWILGMADQGYDFKIDMTRNLPIHSFFAVFLLSSFLLLECLIGNNLYRWIWVLIPAGFFMGAASSVVMELFGACFTCWIPSDLFQAYVILLSGYIGLSWSGRSIMARTCRLPFFRVEFL